MFSLFGFQSAPLTDVRGDMVRDITKREWHAEFQSAPLTDVRGDRFLFCSPPQRFRFQSAPLTDVRGDNKNLGYDIRTAKVSIRSPH